MGLVSFINGSDKTEQHMQKNRTILSYTQKKLKMD